jgi:hypothetical protein
MGILPIVIRKGRSKYTRWVEQKSSVHPDMDGHSESSRLLAQRDRAYGTNGKKLRKNQKEEVAPAGAERFDLYFGAVSFSIDALALIGVGCSRAVWQLYACKSFLLGIRKSAKSVISKLLRFWRFRPPVVRPSNRLQHRSLAKLSQVRSIVYNRLIGLTFVATTDQVLR